jgi:ligand-binding sensor domain-containing protein
MWSGGIWYDPGREAPLGAPEVTSLVLDSEGTLWIATRNGIVSYRRGGHWRAYGPAEGLADPHVMILREVGEPRSLWAGSYRGWLYRFDPGSRRWRAVMSKGQLASGQAKL